MESFLSLFDPSEPDEMNETDSIDNSETDSDNCNNNNTNKNNLKNLNQQNCINGKTKAIIGQNESNNTITNNNKKLNGNHTISNNSHHNSNFNSLNGQSNNTHNSNHKIIIDFEQGILPPEPQLGNIEYKLKLINPSKQRFEHLVTQMKWRLREGQGEAIYEIGVSDSGQLQGLADGDMKASLNTLKQMAHKLGASTTVLRRKSIVGRRCVTEVLVRKIPDDQHNIEVRVAVLGGVNAGKSTLLGVLTQGELDNGRGRARLNMFRHMHEIQSGRTSCISHETLGFDIQGNVINYKYNEMMTAEEISDRSSKLVTFMDLAGHRRYIKTTVQALTGYLPHHAMLVAASGIEGVNSMTKEHLDIVLALDMPFFIVITKIDFTPADSTLLELKSILTSVGCRKVPLLVTTEDDVLTAGSHLLSEQIVPIFCVSNVKGDGLELLTKFFNVLSPGISNSEKERLEQEPCEFHVDEIFKVSEVGPVIGGLLVKGILTENMPMKIGPLANGSFLPVTIHSIHRNKAPYRAVRAGQSASLAFVQNQNLSMLRSGMVLLPDNLDEPPYGSLFFQVSQLLSHLLDFIIHYFPFHFRQKFLFFFMQPPYTKVFKPPFTLEAFVKQPLSKVSWAVEKLAQMTVHRCYSALSVIPNMWHPVCEFYFVKVLAKELVKLHKYFHLIKISNNFNMQITTFLYTCRLDKLTNE